MTTYADLSREMPPSEMVKRAVTHCNEKGSALDLGAGALRDTKYLLSEGFKVTAIDRDPVMLEVAATVADKDLDAHQMQFAEFTFAPHSYDLLVARNTLPFESSETFTDLWTQVVMSIKPGGVFCGNFFGPNDTWAISKPLMSFHTRDEVEALINDFEKIEFNEREEDATDIRGNPKHWHIFEVIARKK